MTHLQRILFLMAAPFLLTALTPAADLSITAANVAKTSTTTTADGTASTTVTAGSAVYDAGSSAWADADSNASGTDDVAGITLNDAVSNQPLKIATAGEVTLGAGVMAKGEIFFLSDTAGGIMPMGDVSANDFVTVIGWAKTDAIIVVDLMTSSVQNNASGS